MFFYFQDDNGGEVTRGELEKIIGGGLTKWNWADEDTEEEGGGKKFIFKILCIM